MSAEPRAALEALTYALERHLEACSARRGDNDPAVLAAADAVADAFEAYDDALMDAYNEVTPLELYTEDDDLDDDFGGVDDDDFDDYDDDYDDDDEGDDDEGDDEGR